MDYLQHKVDNLKIIVFDLDYTLWPFWVDTHVTPPFRHRNGKVVDNSGQVVKHYPYVTEVLEKLSSLGYTLGIASRTTATDEAEQLIELFDWNKLIKYKEIFPGCKINHFNNIHTDSGIPFSQMLFFDDESRNIRDLMSKGVVSILVNKGIDKNVVINGIQTFVNQNQSS
ncbi:magnesium-dependent phosphatase 1-like [Oppia nitens]|uniref:magnesium-dependent phosphatase 1-like n=1 Tax=Oppia nitens TaxID=1686743 RepID=UPI0023DB733B|nr:magnesium-dependent phosphatase 1-like [Oppia nitens]